MRIDLLSVLIWVQTVYKCYQQTTKSVIQPYFSGYKGSRSIRGSGPSQTQDEPGPDYDG